MDLNNINEYRDIRFKRTYRTLGKMSWWRIALGVILIVFVLLLSGLVSQMFASRGQFHTAEKLMISPAWMEKYKPETKAFIEAGVLYQDGDYEAAATAFNAIEDVDAADSMYSLTCLKLALEHNAEDDFEAAYSAIINADSSFLSNEDSEEYLTLCNSLYEHFSLVQNEEAQSCADNLKAIIDEFRQN